VLLKSLDNENELLRRTANGDQSAYAILFNHYWGQIYSTAMAFTKSPELSEDIAQDVFAKIWIKKETLREINKFEAFLYTIARNLILDRLRKHVFTKDHEDYLLLYFEESSPNPSRQLEFKEFEATIHAAIDKLPPQQRTAFRLSRFQGLNHEEIAGQMGVSKQSVKSYIVRSIVSLRNSMQEHSGSISLILYIFFF
jgi:RNA polymerase sigma-70 factor (family 1)